MIRILTTEIRRYILVTHRSKISKIVSSPTIENRSIQQNFFRYFLLLSFLLIVGKSQEKLKISFDIVFCVLPTKTFIPYISIRFRKCMITENE